MNESIPETRKFENVSVILPAVNETYLLRQTADMILSTCDKKDIRELFIVLCDRSTPECIRTAEEIKETSAGVPVEIYFQKKPFVGMAVREAIERVKGSHLIIMSTDLETDPALVPIMIERAKENPNGIATASRWIRGGSFTGYSKVKLFLNYIFQKMLSVIFLTGCTDLTFGYRVFPTKLMQAIDWEEEKHPFFLETALKPLRLGIKITEIPAKWEARTEGDSQNTFFENFKYLKTAIRVRFMGKNKVLRGGG